MGELVEHSSFFDMEPMRDTLKARIFLARVR